MNLVDTNPFCHRENNKNGIRKNGASNKRKNKTINIIWEKQAKKTGWGERRMETLSIFRVVVDNVVLVD